MDHCNRANSPWEKWQLGKERLAKAEAEPALLGSALISLHGALEDQFRQILVALPSRSTAEQLRILDVSQVKWRELCDLMQQDAGLSAGDARYILRMNALRNQVGHGSEFNGSYLDLVKYAEFVGGWLESTVDSTIGAPIGATVGTSHQSTLPLDRAGVNRCPQCQSLHVKGLNLVHDRGISVMEHRRGRKTTRQTGLSLRAAPPDKKAYATALSWSLGTFFLFPLFTGPVVSALSLIPLVGYILAGLAGVLCTIALVWGMVYPFYRTWKFNQTQYPLLLERWQRSFLCEQCGHIYHWQALARSQ